MSSRRLYLANTSPMSALFNRPHSPPNFPKSHRTGRMSWRRSPATSAAGPAPALATHFHDALRAADVALVRELVFREPRLANARDPTRGRFKATPVMSATLSCCLASSSSSRRSEAATASRAVVLINLLAAKGATLQTKDERKRQALMVACASGAHPSIVRCLVDWNRAEGAALSWRDEDSDGQTALMLACANGHGRLAAFVMDKLLTTRDWDDVRHPLQLLAVAVASRDERSAVELLRARSLQRAVFQDKGGVDNMTLHGEWRQVDARREDGASVAICVAGAVEHGMSRLVQDMHALNRKRVGRAAWLAIHRLQTREAPKRKSSRRRVEAQPAPEVVVPRGIADVIDLHKRDTVWESVRLLFLVRLKHVRAPMPGYARSRSASAVGFIRHVASLPDDLFRSVVDYVKQPFDDHAEAQKEHFRVLVVQDSW